MRFEVNQVVLLVGVNFLSTRLGKRGDRGVTFRVPQTDDVINEIKFVESTVKEHHKVPDEWADEPKYDGFIFDVQGHRGTNQYPRASYGQISDAQDRVISIIDDLYENKYKEDYDKFEQGDEIVNFTTATNMFDTINRGIEYFGRHKMPKEAEALKVQYSRFEAALKEQFPQYSIVDKEIIEGSKIRHTVVEKV